MGITERDEVILRQLAEQVREIADLPIQKEKMEMWSRLNKLEDVRPLIGVYDGIPWHELDVNKELTLKTKDKFCQKVEKQLQQTLYKWRHLPCDMVVEGKFYSSPVIKDTGFGISEDVDTAKNDELSNILSRDFHPQIQSEEDIEKIKTPKVTYDAKASERKHKKLKDIFEDILEVTKRGVRRLWCQPWDRLVTWWGVEEALRDLVARPKLVHKAMDRLINAYLSRLDQLEELNLLALNNNNIRTGSGGLGFTEELPGDDFDPEHIKPHNMWGAARAQILSDVSPKMHQEFAIDYERRWLKRFGLSYYGCCEPLHHKIEVLKEIPNLRKISISPWADTERAASRIGSDYVFSYSPNPAILAGDSWEPDLARRKIRNVLEKAENCVVEVIMKDVSTVRHKPERLWEWSEIAMEEAQR